MDVSIRQVDPVAVDKVLGPRVHIAVEKRQ